ncbi:hypothetical protein IV203_012992 [Nitzschia inconspicua]|uniref:Uncharacterized protein n=1 Tax=Nitzschia inconspicua TaxID=303405 RepID=A0A9K3M4S8_9STRA|nr:hypothetical protein IV203_012992 [Nitzschia inconspicua]
MDAQFVKSRGLNGVESTPGMSIKMDRGMALYLGCFHDAPFLGLYCSTEFGKTDKFWLKNRWIFHHTNTCKHHYYIVGPRAMRKDQKLVEQQLSCQRPNVSFNQMVAQKNLQRLNVISGETS